MYVLDPQTEPGHPILWNTYVAAMWSNSALLVLVVSRNIDVPIVHRSRLPEIGKGGQVMIVSTCPPTRLCVLGLTSTTN